MTTIDLAKKIDNLSKKIEELEYWAFCISESEEYLEKNMEVILNKLGIDPVYPDDWDDEDEEVS